MHARSSPVRWQKERKSEERQDGVVWGEEGGRALLCPGDGGQRDCIQVLIMLLLMDPCMYFNSEMVALKKNDKWNNLEGIFLL